MSKWVPVELSGEQKANKVGGASALVVSQYYHSRIVPVEGRAEGAVVHAVLVTVVPAEVVVAWVRAAANLATSDRPHSRPAASRWAPSGQVASAEWVT